MSNPAYPSTYLSLASRNLQQLSNLLDSLWCFYERYERNKGGIEAILFASTKKQIVAVLNAELLQSDKKSLNAIQADFYEGLDILFKLDFF